MKKPQYLIFDCDGVLVDSELIANRIEAQVKTALGFPISMQEHIRKFVGLGSNNLDLQRELVHLPKHYMEHIDELLMKAYRSELQPVHRASETLARISLPKCVASSNSPSWLDFKLKHTQLDQYFQNNLFSGHSVKFNKPAPDIFFYVTERMGWKASDCLVIEDSVPGVIGAKAAGMKVCGFLGASHIFDGDADRLIQAGADYLIKDFENLLVFL